VHPIVPRSYSEKIVDYRKIAIGVSVVVAPRKPVENAFTESLNRRGGKPLSAHQSSNVRI
jgi:hypothetical protein